MAFDYFYGRQAEQYQFYRIPKLLITDGRFSNISADAKLLYGLMLDRAALSAQNGWFDEENRVYIIYTVTQIMADLHCANQKAAKLLKELEGKNAGLIQRKRQGLGKPDLIYVMNFASDINDPEMPSDNPEKPDSDGTSPDVWKSHFQTCENHTEIILILNRLIVIRLILSIYQRKLWITIRLLWKRMMGWMRWIGDRNIKSFSRRNWMSNP